MSHFSTDAGTLILTNLKTVKYHRYRSFILEEYCRFLFQIFSNFNIFKRKVEQMLLFLTKAGAASNYHQMWLIVHLTDILHHNRL